jgi:large subunit ribosomal protein L18
MSSIKTLHRQARHRRVRAKVRGTAARPRLSVFKSLTSISVQLIDDDAGRTLAAATSGTTKKTKSTKTTKGTKNLEAAKNLGTVIAEKAKEKKISTVVFDRGGYKYHGRIKALADAAREGGLKF